MSTDTLEAPARTTPDTARTLLVNSSIAAILAAALMVFVHELVHLFIGVAFGTSSTLYPYGVTYTPELPPTQLAIAAIAAPIFSLVTGFAMTRWQPFAARGGFAQLLWIWLAFTSIMEGVGYLVITPFGAGDTATALDALGWPFWVGILACVLGVGLMFVTARMFSPYIIRYAGHDKPRQWGLAFWPWLIGSVVNMALALFYMNAGGMDVSPGVTIAILMAGTAVFVFAPMGFIFLKQFLGEPERPLGLAPVPVAGLVGIALIVGLNIFLLGGLTLG